MPEVAITGIGLVTPLGATAATTRAAWREGVPPRCEALPAVFGPELAGTPVAVPPPFDLAARFGGRKLLKFMSRAAGYGCAAAVEAMTAAAVLDRYDPPAVGLFSASGIATTGFDEVRPLVEAALDGAGRFDTVGFGQRGLARANPLLGFRLLANMPGSLVSIITGVKGHHLLLSPGESQTIAVLREAWLAVAGGTVDAALAGAADDLANPIGLIHLRQRPGPAVAGPPAAAAAYLVLERADRCPRERALARLAGVTVADAAPGGDDPLATRLGRAGTAAPAVLLALAALGEAVPRTIADAAGRRATFTLGDPP